MIGIGLGQVPLRSMGACCVSMHPEPEVSEHHGSKATKLHETLGI